MQKKLPLSDNSQYKCYNKEKILKKIIQYDYVDMDSEEQAV